jgi:protein-disulfide isomerase
MTIKDIKSVTKHSGLLGALVLTGVLLCVAGMVQAQEITGYVSPNKNDLPPSLKKNPELRSTNLESPPAYGPEDAKVLIVNFADFECPACKRASQATHQIAYQYPGQVRIEFWHHPLAIHKTAHEAAAASIAAQKQGKFWEMHDLLFQNGRHDTATLEQHAQTLGLDLERFWADMNSPEVRQRIDDESELADAMGAPRTPGYVINGKVREGWGSWVGLRQQVKRELEEVNRLLDQGMSVEEAHQERALANNDNSETYELYRTRILEP